ncbi:MAG TPA: NACHT domain-containing protein, partial [Roseiflexaceae bacterium]|nr:NACHT domain-containing protein [Roseiflexaceae bacterium]
MTDPPGPPRQPQIEHNPATDSAQFDQRKGLFAEGGTFNGQVIGYQENNVTQVLPALPTPNTLTPRQRAELLDRLVLRYRERLDNALAHKVRLQLGLHTRPDAVDPAWRRLHLRGLVISKVVPPGTPVVELFDGQQEQLLVLGAPGAGKTTLIVELAQALAARAQLNLQVRLPVVLNIAAWHSGQTLREWLQRALRDVLGVSRRFAAQLAGSDDLLLLLDGLDEVAADHRATCVAAIIA